MIERRRVSDQIVDEIKKKIKSGEYATNTKLPSENELAKLFNVSRVPIREALSALAAHGIVEAKHGEGSWIRPFPIENIINKHLIETITFDRILNLLETRIILETQAAAFAAERHKDVDLSKMYDAQKRLFIELDDPEKVSDEADFIFHQAIFQSTYNEVLIEVLNNLSDVYYQAMKTSLTINTKIQGKKKQVYEEHQAILKAISMKDSKQAAEMMKIHLENSQAKLLIYKHLFK
ncbi:FadR/GntR family transcriptional regulator [Peribacillus muralis]|uniref:FadR/GntR family transcriptional regulator n=1 Tax=Peribacillus muralis TaxID=264697 RepID=UPI00366C5862